MSAIGSVNMVCQVPPATMAFCTFGLICRIYFQRFVYQEKLPKTEPLTGILQAFILEFRGTSFQITTTNPFF